MRDGQQAGSEGSLTSDPCSSVKDDQTAVMS